MSFCTVIFLRFIAVAICYDHNVSSVNLFYITLIIIISLLNPLVVYNTKLQGRSRIRRTHNYTWHRRQKQLNPIVTVGNKIASFSIDDGDGSEKVTFKMNLRFFKLCRAYSNSLKM